MALLYGFGRRQGVDQAVADARFEALSDADKNFYHNYLPFLLLEVDIGVVTEGSIPHITARLEVANQNMVASTRAWLLENGYQKDMELSGYRAIFELYLDRFLGYTANVSTTTSTEFVKRIADRARQRTPRLTREQALEISKVKG